MSTPAHQPPDRWLSISHAFSVCRTTHLANTQPEARDCHACCKRLCEVCRQRLLAAKQMVKKAERLGR